MTLFGLVAALTWAAVAVYVTRLIVRTWKENVDLRAHADVKIAAYRVNADEAIARLQHPEAPARELTRSDIQLPDDLEAYAASWNDRWAQDDTRQTLRQLFLDHHTGDTEATWQRVRRAVGVGELP